MSERPIWLSEYDQMIRPTSKWKINDPNALKLQGPGCEVACTYCNQAFMDRNDEGMRLSSYLSPYDGGISVNTHLNVDRTEVARIEEDELIQELIIYPYLLPTTPVVINNFSDPGLNWTESIRLAHRIHSEIDHQSTTIFITKMPMSQSHLDELEGFKAEGGKPLVVVTYSEMPRTIEKASNPKRIKTMRYLHAVGIPVIASLRPIIRGMNDSEETLSTIVNSIAGNVDAVIYGGLFIDPNYTLQAFAKAGFNLDPEYVKYMYTRAKHLPNDIRDRVQRIIEPQKIGAPLYDHATCAVAFIETVKYSQPRANRMALWVNGRQTNFHTCGNICSQDQIGQCVTAHNRPNEVAASDAKTTLSKIDPDGRYSSLGFIPSITQSGMLLIENGALNILETMPIMEASGKRIDNLPDREGFLFRCAEALSNYLGIDSSVIHDAFQVDQEWVLVVEGDLTGDNNVLATRYVRTNSRCRCHIIDINQYQEQKKAVESLIRNGNI